MKQLFDDNDTALDWKKSFVKTHSKRCDRCQKAILLCMLNGKVKGHEKWLPFNPDGTQHACSESAKHNPLYYRQPRVRKAALLYTQGDMNHDESVS